MCKGCWVTANGERALSLGVTLHCVGICLQDVDPSFPIWASETLEITGMCRHARLAWPSFLLERKSSLVSPKHIHRAVTKQRHVTAGWHALENTIRMGGHCAVISRDHILYRTVTPVLCTRLYRRDWSRMLAYFQKKKTGFCLGTDSQSRERERERASKQGVLLWGLGFGGRVGPVLLASHLHADDTLYHYMEGRCSYWYVNKVSCVLWLCDQVNQASVVDLYLSRSRTLKFTQMRSIICILTHSYPLHFVTAIGLFFLRSRWDSWKNEIKYI